jgi:NitT/TauT family transport system substrate-binding protein
LLVADSGFKGYGSMIATSDKKIEQQPDLVQRFVDASIEGWYLYLFSDPTPANTLIKKANPEMNDALIAYGIDSMKKHGILDSGDAKTMGIGAMSADRWTEFYQTVSDQGLYPKGLDVTKAYTLQFVNKKVGMDQKN